MSYLKYVLCSFVFVGLLSTLCNASDSCFRSKNRYGTMPSTHIVDYRDAQGHRRSSVMTTANGISTIDRYDNKGYAGYSEINMMSGNIGIAEHYNRRGNYIGDSTIIVVGDLQCED